MSRRIALSQRVDIVPSRGERRDALDQAWAGLLGDLGLVPLPVPNQPDLVERLYAACPWDAVLLTGGNTLAAYGGDAPERDETESRLIALARRQRLPLLGVCRGMQMLLHVLGGRLHPVDGHVARRHDVDTPQGARTVNSFHALAVTEAPPGITVTARAADGVIEAFRHDTEPLAGMMWHPERETPAAPLDTAFLKAFFGPCAP